VIDGELVMAKASILNKGLNNWWEKVVLKKSNPEPEKASK
jgi:hypothetical protein